MPARQPLEMPSRYGFHSTRPAPWKRVSAALSVDLQSKSGVNFRRTRRRCFSVWLSRSGKAWEDRPDRVVRHPLHSWAPHTGSRRSPCVMPRGSSRPLVSQLSGPLRGSWRPREFTGGRRSRIETTVASGCFKTLAVTDPRLASGLGQPISIKLLTLVKSDNCAINAADDPMRNGESWISQVTSPINGGLIGTPIGQARPK